MTPTTRCGCRAPARWPAGSTPRCGTRPATRQKAQGWFPFVLDTNGNGKLDEFTEPGKPAEAGKDMRFNPGSGPYAVMPHPTDGSIWYTSGVFGGTPAVPALRSEDQAQRVLRGAEGSHRPARRRHRQGRRAVGLRLRRPSRRFDRRKCKAPLNGPNATGNHCPEGWTLHKYPGPGFDGFAELQRRGELLHLGRPSQRGRARRRTCRSRPRTCRTASSASRTAR